MALWEFIRHIDSKRGGLAAPNSTKNGFMTCNLFLGTPTLASPKHPHANLPRSVVLLGTDYCSDCELLEYICMVAKELRYALLA